MKLSVLMPAHNAKRTILTSVKSVLRRLPPKSELIVLFDGLDFDSEKSINNLNDTRIKVISVNVNQGVSKSRNHLLNVACGEYVATIDADDLLLGNRLQRQIDFLNENLNTIVFTNTLYFYENRKILRFKPGIPFELTSENSKIALCLYDPFVNSTMMARKTTLMDLSGYEETVSEDYELWVRAAISGIKLVKLNYYGAIYRVHDKQMTNDAIWKANLLNDSKLNNSLSRLRSTIAPNSTDLNEQIKHIENLLRKKSKKAYLEYKVYS